MKNSYLPEEIEDIKNRTQKAEEVLKELQLNPSAVIQKVRIVSGGVEGFIDQVIPYLQDTKYQGRISSIQAKDLK